MMLPLMHHGMLISGVPYSVKELNKTATGGTPYGPSHLDKHDGTHAAEEEAIYRAFGKAYRRTRS